jgi:hypothetical protein
MQIRLSRELVIVVDDKEDTAFLGAVRRKQTMFPKGVKSIGKERIEL